MSNIIDEKNIEKNKDYLINILQKLTNCSVGMEIKYKSLEDLFNLEILMPIIMFLHIFGIVTKNEDSLIVKSETSKLFIKSLIEYIDNDLTILSNWEEHKGRPVDVSETNSLFSWVFLYLIEKQRMNKLGEQCKSIKSNQVVKAVFKIKINGKDCFLMQYDSKNKQYQLIGGIVEMFDKNLDIAIVREISEELPESNLEYNQNYKLKQIYKSESKEKFLSSKFCAYVDYELIMFQVYDVSIDLLKGKNAVNRKENMWITFDEIKSGKARDGRNIFNLTPKMIDEMRIMNYSFINNKYDLINLLSDKRLQISGLFITFLALLVAIIQLFK